MNHLSELEFLELLENDESILKPEKATHFSSCVSCREEYNRQLMAHKKLITIRPMNSPVLLAKKVLNNLSQLNISFKPKAKTDWFFIIALAVLFFVAFWYSYLGNLDLLNSSYLQGIKEYAPRVETPVMYTLLKDQLLNFTNYGIKITYLMIGLISISIYWIVDRHINKSIHINKS